MNGRIVCTAAKQTLLVLRNARMLAIWKLRGRTMWYVERLQKAECTKNRDVAIATPCGQLAFQEK